MKNQDGLNTLLYYQFASGHTLVYFKILTGRPFGPFSPTTPWRPASPYQNRYHCECDISLAMDDRTCNKTRCNVPSRHPILVCHLCHPCQEYPVEDIKYDPHGSEWWCMLNIYIFSRYALTGSPLGPAPPGPPLAPILPCSKTTDSVLHLLYLFNSQSQLKVFYSQFLLWDLWNPVAPFHRHHPGKIRWNTNSYSLMGPAIGSSCRLLLNAVIVSSVLQTKRHSLSFQWCQQCLACLWILADPRDKQKSLS